MKASIRRSRSPWQVIVVEASAGPFARLSSTPVRPGSDPAELVSFAEEKGVENASTMRKQELMFAILKQLAIQENRHYWRRRRLGALGRFCDAVVPFGLSTTIEGALGAAAASHEAAIALDNSFSAPEESKFPCLRLLFRFKRSISTSAPFSVERYHASASRSAAPPIVRTLCALTATKNAPTFWQNEAKNP